MNDNITITAIKKSDKKQAKILQKIINVQYKEYKEIIDAITECRMYIELVWGIKTPNKPFEKILQAIVERDINKIVK